MLASGLINVSEIFLAERGAAPWRVWVRAAVDGVSELGLVIGSVQRAAPLLERRNVMAVYPLAFLPWAAGILGAALAPEHLGRCGSAWSSPGSATAWRSR